MARPSRGLQCVACALPLLLAACGALLPPREPIESMPAEPAPWVPAHPVPDPGEGRSPLAPRQ